MITLNDLFSLNKAWSDSSFVIVFDLSNDSESHKLRVRFARSLYGDRQVVGFADEFINIR